MEVPAGYSIYLVPALLLGSRGPFWVYPRPAPGRSADARFGHHVRPAVERCPLPGQGEGSPGERRAWCRCARVICACRLRARRVTFACSSRKRAPGPPTTSKGESKPRSAALAPRPAFARPRLTRLSCLARPTTCTRTGRTSRYFAVVPRWRRALRVRVCVRARVRACVRATVRACFRTQTVLLTRLSALAAPRADHVRQRG